MGNSGEDRAQFIGDEAVAIGGRVVVSVKIKFFFGAIVLVEGFVKGRNRALESVLVRVPLRAHQTHFELLGGGDDEVFTDPNSVGLERR